MDTAAARSATLPGDWRLGRKAGRFTMCRWNAYFGQPLLVEDLLVKTQHGLIDQSMHARMGVEDDSLGASAVAGIAP
jgi:hypothetical protein